MNLNLKQTFTNIDDEVYTVNWGKGASRTEAAPLVDLTMEKALLLSLRAVKGETDERERAFALLKKIKKAGDSIEIKNSKIGFIKKAVMDSFSDNYLTGLICEILDGKNSDSPDEDAESDSETE